MNWAYDLSSIRSSNTLSKRKYRHFPRKYPKKSLPNFRGATAQQYSAHLPVHVWLNLFGIFDNRKPKSNFLSKTCAKDVRIYAGSNESANCLLLLSSQFEINVVKVWRHKTITLICVYCCDAIILFHVLVYSTRFYLSLCNLECSILCKFLPQIYREIN